MPSQTFGISAGENLDDISGAAGGWWTSSEWSSAGVRAWIYSVNASPDGMFAEPKTGAAFGGLSENAAVRGIRRIQI